MEQSMYWKFDLDTSEGNVTLPDLPEVYEVFVLDKFTGTTIPIVQDRLNTIKVYSKTCGAITWSNILDCLDWAFFDPGRFSLCVDSGTPE